MMSAAVVNAAIPMPIMPNRLPRIEVVGCDRPFKAWMKQTLATRYSSVTRFKLIGKPPCSALRCEPLRAAVRGSCLGSRLVLERCGLLLFLPEHLEHAARHEEAAEDVDRRQRHGQHAHGLAQ